MDLLTHLAETGKLQSGSIRQKASSAVLELHVKAGAKPALIVISAYSGAAVPIDVIRGVSASNNGTAKKVFNRNGAFPDDNLATKCFTAPTYTGGEVSKETQSGMGTVPGQAQSGNISPGLGYIIPPNASWVFKFSPGSSTDLIVLWDLAEDLK
jgi:hypothetical protein